MTPKAKKQSSKPSTPKSTPTPHATNTGFRPSLQLSVTFQQQSIAPVHDFITGLPNELLEAVATKLDIDSNSSFRLASKAIYFATQGMYSREYHSNYTVYMNRHELEQLIFNCSKTDISGTHIPRDAITTLTLHPTCFEGMADPVQSIAGPLPAKPSIANMHTSLYAPFLWTQHLELDRTGFYLSCLLSAIDLLPSLRNIRIAIGNKSQQGCYVPTGFQRSSGPSHIFFNASIADMMQEITFLFNTVMIALRSQPRSSSTVIRTLDLCPTGMPTSVGCFSAARIETYALDFDHPSTRIVLENLTEFRAHFQMENANRLAVRPIASLIMRMSNLEKLELGAGLALSKWITHGSLDHCKDSQMFFPEIIRNLAEYEVTLPKLKFFKLQGCIVFPEELLAFLVAHKDILEHFHIREVCIFRGWKQIFAGLAQLPGMKMKRFQWEELHSAVPDGHPINGTAPAAGFKYHLRRIVPTVGPGVPAVDSDASADCHDVGEGKLRAELIRWSGSDGYYVHV